MPKKWLPSKFPRFPFFFIFLILFISSCVFAGGDSRDLLLKALAAYEEKNFEAAASYFRKYFPSSGLLKDYVLFWWATSLKETGKEDPAIKLYNRVSQDSPIRKRTAEELIVLYRKKGDWLSSVNLIREREALEKDKRLEPLWHKEALETGYLSGDPNLAIGNFKILIENFSETKEAIESLEKYGNFYSFKGDELGRARVYINHKDFKKALEYLEKRALAKPWTEEDREALRLKAEAYYGLRDYNKAISILEGLLEKRDEEEIRLRLGEICLAGPFEEKGSNILEKLSGEKEGSRIACLSIWNLLNYWKRKDNEEKTKIYCKRLREGYRQFSLTDKAVWIEGWMSMTKKNYIEADKVWQAFDDISRNSREKMSALYLRSWIKHSSDDKEAKKIFRRLASLYPDTYYGIEALEKTSFVSSNPEPFLKSGKLEGEKDFDRANLLLELGRDEEAIFELEVLRGKRYNDINLRYNLSLLYGKAGKFREAISEAESLVDFFEETGRWPGFLNLSDRRLTEINFPRFYREEAEKMAREFKLDANLIYAVMREESRFNEKDVSSSGAIGLMQIIPSTGKWIAEKVCSGPGQSGLDPKNAIEEDFFKPEVNILLGSWYLRYLLDKFDGDLLLAVAAYNGGPGLIERWVKDGGMADRDIAIEMMPREETRYYCQKVLFSYRMYKMIYGEKDDQKSKSHGS